jgi:hypothetical protein
MDEKRLQINSPRLGLQPSLSWLLIPGYRVSKPNTEYQLPCTEYCVMSNKITNWQEKTTTTLTWTWTTTFGKEVKHNNNFHFFIIADVLPNDKERLPRHSPWCGLQLSFFIIICLYWLPSLEYWPLTTDHWSPSTKYQVLTNTIPK